MGKRGPKPKMCISTTWSPELAYAVGLIATDGCLSKSGRHVDFTSKDKELVETFKKCLKVPHIKIGRKTSGSSKKNYFRVQLASIAFYNWLLKLGMTPRKSKTLSSLQIPDKYFFDFLRGCWDGDGTIYAYWDPRWRSSYMFYVALASASPAFLIWIQKNLTRRINVKGKISPAARSFQLRFAKKESRHLLNKMFYTENTPRLKRKFTKAQKIFKIDTQHNNAQVVKLVNMHA